MDNEQIKRVKIFKDKTKLEQEEDKKKYLECAKMREESGKDYIIFRNEVVIRDNIPDIIRAQRTNSKDRKASTDGKQDNDA